MLFEIRHFTTYTYSKPVFFEPVTIRLKPLCNHFQNRHHFEINIHPEPAGMTGTIDYYGNESIVAWFSGVHPVLEINTHSKVETILDNPYDFIITDRGFETVPLEEYIYNSEIARPYIKNIFENTELKKLVNYMLDKEKHSTLRFINSFCSYIYENFKQVIRESGSPHSPDTTLAKGEGACRDLAVLMIEAMRLVNLPARFVSGYSYNSDVNAREDLHAWIEVYLPGGGWRGFDPNLGLSIDNNYVKLASGISHFDAAPVSGTFRGSDVTTFLDYNVSIDSLE